MVSSETTQKTIQHSADTCISSSDHAQSLLPHLNTGSTTTPATTTTTTITTATTTNRCTSSPTVKTKSRTTTTVDDDLTLNSHSTLSLAELLKPLKKITKQTKATDIKLLNILKSQRRNSVDLRWWNEEKLKCQASLALYDIVQRLEQEETLVVFRKRYQ
jgi:hypothetical protein